MSPYTSFAVVGAGFLGTPIIKALLKQNASVLVLTRSLDKAVPEGAKVVAVDYNDIPLVTRTLREHAVEVVISTLNPADTGLPSQNKIADAAKQAGVKLFAPSEFGGPTAGVQSGFLQQKDESAGKSRFLRSTFNCSQCSTVYIRSIGLPTARFYVSWI